MTIWGLIIMILSVGSVTALFIWAFWKVFTIPGETEKMHGFEGEEPERHSSNPNDHPSNR